jgi:hypothetical protein
MTREEFYKWAKRAYDHAKRNRSCYIGTIPNSNATICYDTTTGKVGVARCHPDDDFDFTIGVAIAYTRCYDFEVPTIIEMKKLSEMKNGDVFFYDDTEYMFIGEACRGLYAVYNIADDNIEQFRDSKNSYRVLI